jgi:Family of unknown function (DUF6496)
MSKHKSNVNPGQYKVAGRERQGEDIVHEQHKARLTQSQAALENRQPYPDWTAPTEEPMPEQQTLERAKRDEAEGKSPSTQAGEFVREEIHHVREGKHGARSTKQAIAIGLSKARRAGVKLGSPRSGPRRVKRKAAQESARAGRKPSPTRARAVRKTLKREGRRAASREALARQARSSARRRTAAQRSRAARKASRTRARNR